ncbi:T7SS effector LXG polymorphic toxin [Heyndrickxia sporothermodurans]
MKVLDVHGFHSGMDQIQARLQSLNEQMEHLQQAVDGIIMLEDSLTGEGGQAIRSYYQEIHQTFLLFFQSFLANYDTIIEKIRDSLQGVEPDKSGYINEIFLDFNLQHGLKKVQSVTGSLTDEANEIISKVSDIVYLPKLQDDESMHHIKRAQEKAKYTLEQLHNFDRQATQSLDTVDKDVQTMIRFVQQMQASFKGDKQILIDFTPKILMKSEAYRSLLGEFVQKAHMTPIKTVDREAYGNYKSIKYHVYPDGLIVMAYQKIGSDSQVYYEVVTEIPKEIEDGVTVGMIEPTIDKILSGIYSASGRAVGDTIEGLKGMYELAEKYLGPNPSPDLLLKAGLLGTEIYLNPKKKYGQMVDAGKYMVEAVKTGFDKNVIHGDAKSRSEYFTYILTTLGIGVLGDKGISKIGQAGAKIGKIGKLASEIKGFNPALGTVTTGPIPYNVMNQLSDQIQQSVKKAFGDGGKVGKGIGKGSIGVSEVKTFVDKGKQYTNGRKNRLKPDIRYKTGEYDYFYETDNLGRIEKFETDKLQLTERGKRLSHSKNTPGKVKGQDHAGHLAGDRFGGSPKIDNLVSQLSDVNLKQYKKIENEWAAALNETPPKKVTVKVEIIYSGSDMRPDKFKVMYTIDGKRSSRVLEN